jgi:A/G-specific adenine glycosylase
VERALADWYRPRAGRYPWRLRPDPYDVLVSEIMLQQTQAARVVPAFERFVAAFPDVRSLASATRADVLRAWGALGYNRRAVSLHEAAKELLARHEGLVPADPVALRSLPGVGPYTAAAVASIAFGVAVPAIDTNVARVVRRVRLGADDAPPASVSEAAATWIDRSAPGTWNQVLMDLGRDVCRPAPRCDRCPLARTCVFHRAGASPTRAGRRQPPFHGSFRQVRGAIVRALRSRTSVSLSALARELDQPIGRITEAARALSRDGVVHAGPAALAGRPAGRLRLPD